MGLSSPERTYSSGPGDIHTAWDRPEPITWRQMVVKQVSFLGMADELRAPTTSICLELPHSTNGGHVHVKSSRLVFLKPGCTLANALKSICYEWELLAHRRSRKKCSICFGMEVVFLLPPPPLVSLLPLLLQLQYKYYTSTFLSQSVYHYNCYYH